MEIHGLVTSRLLKVRIKKKSEHWSLMIGRLYDYINSATFFELHGE